MYDFPLHTWIDSQNGLGEGGFSAAALSHQPQTFPGINLKIRIPYHALAFPPEKPFRQSPSLSAGAFRLLRRLIAFAVLVVHE